MRFWQFTRFDFGLIIQKIFAYVKHFRVIVIEFYKK